MRASENKQNQMEIEPNIAYESKNYGIDKYLYRTS